MRATELREEHPRKVECIINQVRTLGLITLTGGEANTDLILTPINLALGATVFKFRLIYVFSLTTPPFHENYKFRDLMSYNITRAYLFDIADVEHVDLASADPKARLVLT